ncbi:MULTISPECIES: non-ribosomal peptide synthetase [unclassified Streptomyces]|uniref:non-ribosomal peptide synthetase n=1 Tax=unclassified Streptomyces TaxID=2593676 RepID=UPI001BE6B741|nr:MULTISPECIES: non-ribosomal peptide synthetase [unclassified Streptomyces]MBT2408591.1 amino acid adenylation domain-containing protein [Streptomyces sp. ISL-21]MBT2608725.1 amino acid adenylation domain-containing protein [Streptomyces sp. ISL-87]
MPSAAGPHHEASALIDVAPAGVAEPRLSLTPVQHGVLFDTARDPDAGLGVVQHVFRVTGALDRDALGAAWQALVDEHEVLRSEFGWDESGKPYRTIRAEVIARLEWYDWPQAIEVEAELERTLQHHREAGAGLDTAPGARLFAARLGSESHLLVWTSSQAHLDGRSRGLLVARLLAGYAARTLAEPPAAASEAVPAQPRQRVGGQLADDGFWREQLAQSDETNPFPTITEPHGARSAETAESAGIAEHAVALGAAEIAALETLGRVHGSHAVVHAVWAFVLSRYTRSRTVLFGSTRPNGAAEGVAAGMALATLPALLQVEPDDTVIGLVTRAAEHLRTIDEHGMTPLSTVQALVGRPGVPLFDTVVVCDSGTAARTAVAGIEVVLHSTSRRIGFPVVLTFDDAASPVVHVEYDLSRLDGAAAADLATAFCTVLRAFALDSAARLHTIGLLDPSASQELVEGTNPPPIPPCETTVVATFLSEAARRQAHTAIVCGDERVGYADLAAQVEALARRLVAAGVGPETVVGVFLERSPRLVVGLLAVLRAGGAFLPLDPVLPDRRTAFALRDSGARVLLTEDLLAARGAALVPPRRGMRTVNLDISEGDWATLAYTSAVAPMPDAADLAYVTYTSGSTGVPKGVAIDHRSLATNTRSVAQSYAIGSDDVVAQFSSVNFDAALEQMLLPLTTGATLLLRGPDLWDPVELLGILQTEGVTVLELTPQYGYELALSLSREVSLAPDKLRLLILGGEAVATAELARWRQLVPDLRLVVGYGPTEVTITTSGWTYEPAQWAGEVALLGRLLAHLRAYVVDEELHPVPLRVPGEICLGGIGVARGYAGQPGMTAASFVPDPFVDSPGVRMYRSGDIGAWRPDGNLVFTGRADEQVKIRGTRVEPGETAAALRRQTGVAAAAVLVVPGRDTREPSRLVGYVTPADPAAPPDPEKLRVELTAELSAAAVPSSIVVLPALPLTANGKLDRAALPLPMAQPSSARPASAGSAFERLLREVWAAVLGVPEVGPDDDFFALGGNSLAMLQVSARVKQRAGYEIPLRQFFRHTTVSSLAQALDGGHGRK